MTTIDEIIEAVILEQSATASQSMALIAEIERLRKELHDIKHTDDNALLCPICNPIITHLG